MSKRTLDAFFAAPKPKKQKKSGLYKEDSKGVIELEPSPSPSPLPVVTTCKETIEIVSDDDEIAVVAETKVVKSSSVAAPVVLTNTGFAITAPDRDTSPSGPPSTHPTYPFPIPSLPRHLSEHMKPSKEPRAINDGIDLDLLCYEPYMASSLARDYGEFLRRELPFYRVQYKINRFGKETEINTPRYTTVFGIDDTSRFSPDGQILDARTGNPSPANKYKTCRPRPIPQCLQSLLDATSECTNTSYNFALVNYYASGQDSISFHSDDEHFLEKEPAIASFSFLGARDFLLKHKPVKEQGQPVDGAKKGEEKPMKFNLTSGTLILMRGKTQSNWLHSIPKRASNGVRAPAIQGRINITFRKNMTAAGTENYYRYNVGTGPVWKWDEKKKEMKLHEASAPNSRRGSRIPSYRLEGA